MPKWGLTMEEGTLTNWLVQEGAQVKEGDILAEIETDKILNQLECPADGVMTKILVPGGSEAVAVGTVLCEIETD
ncbi:MAG: biotin/lipoyl-binding protein [Anaerolineae bacterium]|nr:biotin/lipoyl-binding protein [Anaerolineae bacterium]